LASQALKEWTVIEEEKSNGAIEFWSFEHPLLLSNAFTWLKLLELGQLVALLASSNKVRANDSHHLQ
jgi:hypothetical protein